MNYLKKLSIKNPGPPQVKPFAESSESDKELVTPVRWENTNSLNNLRKRGDSISSSKRPKSIADSSNGSEKSEEISESDSSPQAVREKLS